jgi:uncharacterized protein (DUF2141 family)
MSMNRPRNWLRFPLLTALVLLPLAAPALLAQRNDASGAHEAGCTLRIHVDGLRNSKGNIGTAIYKSAEGWPDDTSKAFRIGPAEISPGERKGTAVWENLPAAVYGVVAIHDENSNARLDKNMFGIPKEGFGFANNPHVGWGPPAFKEALVLVACPVTEITIHLQYR